jgi:hypothetical protein
MGGACSTDGREERCIQYFGRKTYREETAWTTYAYHVYRRIILELILEKEGMKVWTGFIWLRIGISGYCCVHGNEPSGSIKRRGIA